MFFSIGPESKKNFSTSYQLGSFVISTDPGWNQQGNYLYKGYADNCQLDLNLAEISGASEPQHTGNFTILHYDPAKNCVRVCTNQYRSYKLYAGPKELTNLLATDAVFWADQQVVVNADYSVSQQPLNLSHVFADTDSVLTVAQAQENIHNILTNTVDNYYRQNSDPIMLFCSGGVDTILLYTMLANRPITVIDYEYYKLDHFTTVNQATLNQYWAYKQIHHWDCSTVLATGSHGDEYLLRGPNTIAMLTAWHDINFGAVINARPGAYHHKYFAKYNTLWSDSWNNRKKLQELYPTRHELNCRILDMLLNDHQHWHLGHTITWTPFKNIDLARILLQCPIDQLLPQFVDAQLTKNLIADFDPAAVAFVSAFKNYNSKENLMRLWQYHADSSRLS